MITREEVMDSEERWAKAHLETDVKTIGELMHPDYTIIKPDGSVWNKETALSSYILEKREWSKAGSRDHIVNIYGETALVIGIWEAKGDNNGEPFDYKARYTSLWVKENGKVLIVSDQSTDIK
jgi:ketosteroid isomerase-like protein